MLYEFSGEIVEIAARVLGRSGDEIDVMEKKDIDMLEEEMMRLSVKRSLLKPLSKATLVCTFWTKKPYNLDNLRAQLKSIWKTRKKFEIKITGKNLFIILFNEEDDMEFVL